MSKDLFKEAIADAKAVREAALANAKLALEEAFTPHIKEMLAAKIQEMENSELEEAENVDEMYGAENNGSDISEEYYEENGSVQEELSLEEILAALEEAEQSEMEEAYKTKAKKKKDKANATPTDQAQEDTAYKADTGDSGLDEVIDLEALLAEAEEEEEKEEETEETSEEEEEEVGEMTVEELKDLIRSIVGEMGGGAETEMPAEEEPSEDMMVDLDELLAESEELEESELEEDQMSSEMGAGATVGIEKLAKKLNKSVKWVKDNFNPEELKKVLANIGAAAGGSAGVVGTTESVSEASDETLAEIEALRTELNETNLLNAKLLYSNKIFRANELNENQKLRVINAFDKASNVNEAKLIYETIKDSFTTAKEKKQIKESLGFASKPTGAAPSKSQIVAQPDNTVARLQKLAGII